MRYLALVALGALPANAQQQQCLQLPEALAALAEQYQEAPRVSGLSSNGSLMVITASEGGWFSVLIVTPDGQACMVASGANFEVQDAPPNGDQM